MPSQDTKFGRAAWLNKQNLRAPEFVGTCIRFFNRSARVWFLFQIWRVEYNVRTKAFVLLLFLLLWLEVPETQWRETNLCRILKMVSGTSPVKSVLFSFPILWRSNMFKYCVSGRFIMKWDTALKLHNQQSWRSVLCVLFLEAISRLWYELVT